MHKQVIYWSGSYINMCAIYIIFSPTQSLHAVTADVAQLTKNKRNTFVAKRQEIFLSLIINEHDIYRFINDVNAILLQNIGVYNHTH